MKSFVHEKTMQDTRLTEKKSQFTQLCGGLNVL